MKRLIIILAKIGKIISKILIYINALFTSICCISSTFLIMGLICTLFFYLVSLFSGRDTSDLDVLSVLIMIIFLLCISIISFFLGIGLYTINEKLDNILINKSLEGKTSEKDYNSHNKKNNKHSSIHKKQKTTNSFVEDSQRNQYSIDDRYDKEQQNIISLNSGYHLVLAPPGCGKTDILAERVLYAISKGTDVKDMLCLTFTNRAARNMYDRILEKMGPGIANDLFVGNIHRFCSQFLFEENIIAKNTSIIDEKESILIVHNLLHYDTSIDLTNEQTEYIKDIIKIQHILIQIENGIKYNNFIHNDIITKYHLEEFVNIYKNWTDWLFFGFLSKLPEEKLKLEKAKKFGVSLNVLSIIEKAIHYNLYKENFSLLDFDDLLVLTYNYAFHNINSTKKYKWIQIDEVQDLSPFQFSIIDLFTEKTDNSTIIYLGDEQQAIYSFIGAKLSTLNSLKNRCLSHIHYLHTNYRSPKYLLDVFNSYANKELNVDLSLLPKSVNYKKADNYSLVISSGENKDNEALLAARTAYQLNKKNPNERTAILVPWNKDADLISNILQKYKINHFKISGEDLFSKPQVQLLLAHLQVVYSYDNYQAWAKIFYLTGIFNSITSSRKCIKNWRDNYILPSDLFDYTKSSYLLELNKHIQGKYIVFDTETTGLNVSEDDIVQIAALKIENDKIIERFNILLETDKNIPPMLKDKPNPLIEVYKNSTKHKRKYGLHSFLDFIENLPLIGHNVEYDYNILNHNLIRDCGIYNFKDEHAVYFDTLKIAKIIAPNAPKYTLEHLLKTFDVLGENSHLAEDDVIATKSILDHCVKEFKKIRNNHINYLENNYSIFSDFKNKYNPIYKRTKGMLNNISSSTSPILVEELKRIYADFLELNWIQEEYKIDYFFNFLEKDIIKQEKTPTLLEQLDTHLLDIITLKESDICDGKSLKEKIFISTVHKAKGLEFENIIIFEATEGVYPLFSETKIEKKEESARLFYVAMTRAKKRLLILHCDSISGISKKVNYYCFDKSPTIFLRSISHYFERLESDELSSILT